jgi:hypothetical protein
MPSLTRPSQCGYAEPEGEIPSDSEKITPFKDCTSPYPPYIKIDMQLYACAKRLDVYRSHVRRNVRPDLVSYAVFGVVKSLKVRYVKDWKIGKLIHSIGPRLKRICFRGRETSIGNDVRLLVMYR